MNDDPSNRSSERRGGARRTALKSARILSTDGRDAIDCRIRNISDGGAKLELATPRLLPHTFELEVLGMPTRRCSLRWAKGNLIGVQFED